MLHLGRQCTTVSLYQKEEQYYGAKNPFYTVSLSLERIYSTLWFQKEANVSGFSASTKVRKEQSQIESRKKKGKDDKANKGVVQITMREVDNMEHHAHTDCSEITNAHRSKELPLSQGTINWWDQETHVLHLHALHRSNKA